MITAFWVEIKDERDRYIAEALTGAGYLLTDAETLCRMDNCRKAYVRSINSEVTEEYVRSLPDGARLFSRTLSKTAKCAAEEKNITHVNYLDDETFIVKNAYLTAEGALAYIILNTDTTIRQMPVLVLGYGRVGKSITKLLKDNYSIVSVATDDPIESAIASIFSDNVYSMESYKKDLKNFAVVVNTVPKLILEGDTLKLFDKKCFLLDLASMPGGTDFEAAKSLGIHYMHALGVPGKVAPKTAGIYLKDIIVKHLEKEV